MWAEGFCMCFLHTQHDKLGRSHSPTMHCILLVVTLPCYYIYQVHDSVLANCVYVSSDGAHFTYAHARNLRETPNRHVYPLPLERIRGLGGIMASCLVVKTGEQWETRLSKRLRSRYIGSSVCLQTPPKRETRLGACPSAVLQSRIHA